MKTIIYLTKEEFEDKGKEASLIYPDCVTYNSLESKNKERVMVYKGITYICK